MMNERRGRVGEGKSRTEHIARLSRRRRKRPFLLFAGGFVLWQLFAARHSSRDILFLCGADDAVVRCVRDRCGYSVTARSGTGQRWTPAEQCKPPACFRWGRMPRLTNMIGLPKTLELEAALNASFSRQGLRATPTPGRQSGGRETILHRTHSATAALTASDRSQGKRCHCGKEDHLESANEPKF